MFSPLIIKRIIAKYFYVRKFFLFHFIKRLKEALKI